MHSIEKGASERARGELLATIVGGRELPPLDAVVREISESIARLEGVVVDSAPEAFELTITHVSGVTELGHSHLVSQTEGAVGVRFSDFTGS